MAVDFDSVQQVKKETGADLMTCKKALEETDGDIRFAIALVQERQANGQNHSAENTVRASEKPYGSNSAYVSRGNQIEDIKYIQEQTGASLQVARSVYFDTNKNVDKTIAFLLERRKKADISAPKPTKKNRVVAAVGFLVVIFFLIIPMTVYFLYGSSGSVFSNLFNFSSNTSSSSTKSTTPTQSQITSGKALAEKRFMDTVYNDMTEEEKAKITLTTTYAIQNNYVFYYVKSSVVYEVYKYNCSTGSLTSSTKEEYDAAVASANSSPNTSSSKSGSSSSFGFNESQAKTAIKSYVSTRVQSLGGSSVSDIPTLTITQKSKDSKGWTAEGTILISFRDGDFKEFKYRASGDFYDDGSYRCNSFDEK